MNGKTRSMNNRPGLFNLPAMLIGLARNRYLISVMARRDFAARYKSTFAGLVWVFIQPLVLVVIYTLVFSVFLKVRFSEDGGVFAFSVYLLSALLPWLAFNEALASATTVVRANANLVKRVAFPLEILPLIKAVIPLVQQLVGMAILLAMVLAMNKTVPATTAYLPLIMLFQVLFTAGLCWMFACGAMFIPDLEQALSPLLIVWMFLTPIFYSETMVPAWARVILEANPVSRLVILYRRTLVEGAVPDTGYLVLTGIVCLAFFMLGFFAFMRGKKFFNEML